MIGRSLLIIMKAFAHIRPTRHPKAEDGMTISPDGRQTNDYERIRPSSHTLEIAMMAPLEVADRPCRTTLYTALSFHQTPCRARRSSTCREDAQKADCPPQIVRRSSFCHLISVQDDA